MKRRMMVLVMITVLAASSPAMVACQTEEAAANQEAATSSSSSSSIMGGLETFTTVAAWGDNFFGQLGNGVPLPYPDDSRSTMPVEVSNLDGGELKAIAGGATHSLALKDDGTIWAWGNNESGQLGDGTNANSTQLVKVANLSGVEAISGGGAPSYSLALKDDGTVWSWGYNMVGQLGNGTTTDSSSKPVQVSELDGIEAIAAGGSFSLALKDDGTVWAWGINQDGQLGNGTYTLGTSTPGINTPVQVSNLSAVKAIAGGGQHSLAGW